MKKILIGALVGALIIFIWQTLSWTILDLHRPANQYTPKQTEIMDFLNSQLTEDGGYFLPNVPPGSSMEVMNQYMKEAEGKPWAVISYHKEMDTGMGMNIVRNLLTNFVMAVLFCWILTRIPNPKFSILFTVSLLTGLIVFMNVPYTGYIWYETFDLYAHLLDAVISWGVAGLWFGWYYSRRRTERV